MPAQYIRRRYRKWYAMLEIPAAVRGHFDGKLRFVQSLKTDSESEAHRRALPIVSMWKRRIADARGATPENSEAEFWRTALAQAKGDERETLELLVTDRAHAIEEAKGEKAAKLFADLAFDNVKLIAPLADAWLAEAGYPEKGTYQHRRALALLYTRHTAVSEIDRRTAGTFVMEVLAPGRAPGTVNRLLSTYSRLWRWMMRRGHVEANHWTEQGVSKPRYTEGTGVAGRTGVPGKRRPFTEDEGAQFLAALEGVDLDVAMVAAVTGARLEEITALKPADVTLTDEVAWIDVTEGKTASAARRIPVVVPSVRKMLAKRKAADEPRMFHELGVDRFGDYGPGVSRRVGRRLRAIGLTDPALVADHSWRHRARTLMEHADVSPWVADAVLGHARPGEGLGRYSKGPSDKQLIGAVKAVTLPVTRDRP